MVSLLDDVLDALQRAVPLLDGDARALVQGARRGLTAHLASEARVDARVAAAAAEREARREERRAARLDRRMTSPGATPPVTTDSTTWPRPLLGISPTVTLRDAMRDALAARAALGYVDDPDGQLGAEPVRPATPEDVAYVGALLHDVVHHIRNVEENDLDPKVAGVVDAYIAERDAEEQAAWEKDGGTAQP